MLTQALPDVTSSTQSDTPSTLQWVGMEDIAVPTLLTQAGKNTLPINATSNIYVSLDVPECKGIHMSRMHLAINQLATKPCNKNNIEAMLDNIIASQDGISQSAKIELRFDFLLEKPALLSTEKGFQSYPIVLRAEKNQQRLHCELEITIPYSSTCPCSASLTRQLYADAINAEFTDNNIDKASLLAWVTSQAGSVATPHSQRSYAYINIALADNTWPDLSALIFQLEKVISTAVQTAVKRNDEQEFARLNAQNLMFCEDAARKLKQALEQMSFADDYWFKVEHQESLHAHNAVVIDQKNKINE